MLALHRENLTQALGSFSFKRMSQMAYFFFKAFSEQMGEVLFNGICLFTTAEFDFKNTKYLVASNQS